MHCLKRPRNVADVSFSKDQLEETVTAPPPVRVQHTDYNVNVASHSSRLRTTTTYQDAPPSPSKARYSLHDPVLEEFSEVDLSWLNGPTLEEENSDSDLEEEDQSMDPGLSMEDAEVYQVWLCLLRCILLTYFSG